VPAGLSLQEILVCLFISELLVEEEENSLTPLPVLDDSSSAAKWFAFQQWETALCDKIQ